MSLKIHRALVITAVLGISSLPLVAENCSPVQKGGAFFRARQQVQCSSGSPADLSLETKWNLGMGPHFSVPSVAKESAYPTKCQLSSKTHILDLQFKDIVEWVNENNAVGDEFSFRFIDKETGEVSYESKTNFSDGAGIWLGLPLMSPSQVKLTNAQQIVVTHTESGSCWEAELTQN